MSIDRRIVTILYQNGITDVTKVEKFIGEKDNYYEVIVGGELLKLRIPGFDYLEPEEIFTVFEKEVEKEKDKIEEKIEEKLIENIIQEKTEEYVEIKQNTFEEELLKAEKESKNLEKFFTTKIVSKIEKVEIKKSPEIKKKKEVSKKKIDDEDIDNFIDSL